MKPSSTLIACCSLAATLALSGSARADDLASQVVGKWLLKAGKQEQRIELQANGRCTFLDKPCRWRLDDASYGGIILTQSDGTDLEVHYGQGVITLGNGGFKLANMIFYRVGPDGKSTRPDARAKGACDLPEFKPGKDKGSRKDLPDSGSSIIIPDGWEIGEHQWNPTTGTGTYPIGTPAESREWVFVNISQPGNPIAGLPALVDEAAHQEATGMSEAISKLNNIPLDQLPVQRGATQLMRLGSNPIFAVTYHIASEEMYAIGFVKGDHFYWGAAFSGAAHPELVHQVLYTALHSLKVAGKSAEPAANRSCYDLGYTYLHGIGHEEDATVAADFYRQACDLNDPRGCYQMAALMEGQQGFLEKDQAEEFRLLKKACDLKLGMACTMAGTFLKDGSVPAQPGESDALFKRGCELKDEEGCKAAAGQPQEAQQPPVQQQTAPAPQPQPQPAAPPPAPEPVPPAPAPQPVPAPPPLAAEPAPVPPPPPAYTSTYEPSPAVEQDEEKRSKSEERESRSPPRDPNRTIGLAVMTGLGNSYAGYGAQASLFLLGDFPLNAQLWVGGGFMPGSQMQGVAPSGLFGYTVGLRLMLGSDYHRFTVSGGYGLVTGNRSSATASTTGINGQSYGIGYMYTGDSGIIFSGELGLSKVSSTEIGDQTKPFYTLGLGYKFF